jgi:hypothetical protein
MLDRLVEYALQYSIYTLEAGLFLFLVRKGHWKRQLGVSVYVVCLFTVDALVRPYFLYRYGLDSNPYGYSYWLTDIVLALEAFGLLCIFFRRACTAKMWHYLRLYLALVFVGVGAISYFFISQNYANLQHNFIFEFEKNLFFACLVLATLLFVMLQQAASTDDQLELLVCGMGIQFAGPTASLALMRLTSDLQSAYWLVRHIAPLCTLATLLIWIYAVRRFPVPQKATYGVPDIGKETPALAEVTLHAD